VLEEVGERGELVVGEVELRGGLLARRTKISYVTDG